MLERDGDVLIVCAGRDGAFSLDDAYCAGRLAAAALGEPPAAPRAQRRRDREPRPGPPLRRPMGAPPDLQPRRPRAHPARLPRRCARRGPPRRVSGAAALPRTPGDARTSARMSSDSRRRLGAITALVVGLFVGLTLLPLPVTGPIGPSLGQALWRVLGAGALGIPLLGVGLALAGFERLGSPRHEALGVPHRRAQRAAALPRRACSPTSPWLDLDSRAAPAARLVGVVPGFFAVADPARASASRARCWPGSWRSPPSRWRRSPGIRSSGSSGSPSAPAEGDALRAAAGEARVEARKAGAGAGEAREPAVEEPAKAREEPRAGKADGQGDGKAAKAKPGPEGRAAAWRRARRICGPVWDAGRCSSRRGPRPSTPAKASSNALQERLEETLAEFKVEGDVAGRTTGPVVTQYGVRLRPGVKMNRLVNLADDLALKMSAPLDPGGADSRQGHGGRRGAEPQGARRGAARAAGGRAVVGGGAAAAGGAGARPRGPGRSSPTWPRCRTS